MKRIFELQAVALLGLAALSACQLASTRHEAETRVALPAPDNVCNVKLATPAPVLKLPGTDAPRQAATDDQDVDIAQIHTVNRPLQEIGVWNDQGNGWSVLELALGSSRARSLAVRLRDVTLPTQSSLWLCADDGKQHQGPYTEAPNGELWSASVAASQARIEVWVPSAEREKFSALLTDVYGGYQP